MNKHTSKSADENEQLRARIRELEERARKGAELFNQLVDLTELILNRSRRKDKAEHLDLLAKIRKQGQTLQPKPTAVGSSAGRNWRTNPLKVGIVGLLDGQLTQITGRLGISGRRLKVIDMGKNGRRRPTKIDRVLFLASKSGHALENQLKSKYDTEQTKIVEPIFGTGQMTTRLKELADQS